MIPCLTIWLKVVLPAKAGIQFVLIQANSWIPAFAGMTKVTFAWGIDPIN